MRWWISHMIEVSCFSQKLYSDQKVFSHVNKMFNSFFLVKVALSWFPRPFWKWSRESFIGSSFDKKVRGANDTVALLWKPHDPNFGWSLRVQPEIIALCLKKRKKMPSMIEEVNLVLVLDDALLVKSLPQCRHDNPRVVEPHLQEYWLLKIVCQ